MSDALLKTVDPSMLGLGEPVMVLTQLGAEIARGVVEVRYSTGAVGVRENLSDGSQRTRIYRSAYCMFAPLGSDGNPNPSEDPLQSIAPGQAAPVLFDPDPIVDGMDEEKKAAGAVKQPPTGKKTGPKPKKSSEPIHVPNAPAALQKKLIDTRQMSDDEVDRVLAAIGTAAQQSMRSVGVKDRDIYRKVVAIQDACLKVLAPSSIEESPKPKKLNGK